jgi:DNA-binding response OmpR family regulator
LHKWNEDLLAEEAILKKDTEYAYDELVGLDINKKPYRVLVVEDETGTRKLTTQILKSAGYEVMEAADGRIGVALYKEQNPDMVTMDVKMPFCNGYQALKEILEHDSQAIVVMVTHEASKETVMTILQAGAKDYLLKPVNRIALLTKLKKIRKPSSKNNYVSLDELKFSDRSKQMQEQLDQGQKKAEEAPEGLVENSNLGEEKINEEKNLPPGDA